jgi:DNA-binding NtrC family response regulator
MHEVTNADRGKYRASRARDQLIRPEIPVIIMTAFASIDTAVRSIVPLEQIERHYILYVVQRCNENVTRAAEVLQIHRRTLYRMVGRFRVRDAKADAN